jgi:hypothetical protein
MMMNQSSVLEKCFGLAYECVGHLSRDPSKHMECSVVTSKEVFIRTKTAVAHDLLVIIQTL